MIKKLLPVFALCACFTISAQTDLKVKLRKMSSAYMKGPELKIDSAAQTVWVGANYVGEKIEDASSLETQIEGLTSWGSKYTMTADSAEADIVVNIDFSDLICDNPFMDWNTNESSWFFRMRYYVPSKVTLLNKAGDELYSGDFPIRSVMAEICTETGKTEAALKGLVSEPVLITDETAPEKTVELFTNKISHEVRSLYEYSRVPYYKVFYTFFAKKDRAMYPDLMNANKKFGRSRLKKGVVVTPTVNKEKLQAAEFAVNELVNNDALKTSNNLSSSEIIPLYINLAQIQFMLGDLEKAKATLNSISSMEGEVDFRKEVGLVFGYWD
tara:strand:+ start:539 stop:1519 length:981 start_codon:yes stop_codon:yes gene_type:complete